MSELLNLLFFFSTEQYGQIRNHKRKLSKEPLSFMSKQFRHNNFFLVKREMYIKINKIDHQRFFSDSVSRKGSFIV